MEPAGDKTPIQQGYVLQRNKTESQRLNKQHAMIIDMMDYYIHPSVEQSLGPNANVGDVGTGTGIWLTELAQKLPSTVQLYGFDVSAAQFPEPGLLPNNVTLLEHNVKDKLPVEYHEKFNLVHIRFISGGMNDGDWKLVADNLLEILVPGGAIQWLEPDYLTLLTTKNIDGTAAVAHDNLQQTMLSLSGLLAQVEMGAKILPQVLSDAGMTDVTTQVVLPQNQQIQDEWSKNLIDVGFQTLEGFDKRGIPGAPSMEVLKKWHTKALEEFQKSARYSMPIHVTVGFKPK